MTQAYNIKPTATIMITNPFISLYAVIVHLQTSTCTLLMWRTCCKFKVRARKMICLKMEYWGLFSTRDGENWITDIDVIKF